MEPEALFKLNPRVYTESGWFTDMDTGTTPTYCVVLFKRKPYRHVIELLRDVLEGEVVDVDDRGYQYVWLLDDPVTARRAAQKIRRKLHLWGVLPASKMFVGGGRKEFGSEAKKCKPLPSLRRYDKWLETPAAKGLVRSNIQLPGPDDSKSNERAMSGRVVKRRSSVAAKLRRA